MLGLRFCARAFSSCGERGPLFIAVRGPFIVAASLAEQGLQTHRLSSCGSWAQSLRSIWDLPRPGLEPVSPALAGGFSTTAPPGKPRTSVLNHYVISPQSTHHPLHQATPNFPLRLSSGTSLAAQWLTISLLMQGTRVRVPVREDPTCHGVTKPMRHGY